MKNDEQIVITGDGIDYLLEFGQAFVAPDFVGYALPVDKKRKEIVFFFLDGRIRVVGTEKCLSARKIVKVVDKLIKWGFIEIKEVPFPEFEKSFNLPFDPLEAQYIEEPIFLVKEDY